MTPDNPEGYKDIDRWNGRSGISTHVSARANLVLEETRRYAPGIDTYSYPYKSAMRAHLRNWYILTAVESYSILL